MKINLRWTMALTVVSNLIVCPLLVSGAAPSRSLPAVIEAGFETWDKGGGIDSILATWQRGGLMEGSSKALGQARYFRNMSQALGSYKSHEWVESKAVSRASEVIYLAINFERGVVYGRFLIYRGGKDSVVQNMDFSERPEAIMPWLAFEAGRMSD